MLQYTADTMPPARATRRDSSVGRAPACRSEGPQLDPRSGQIRALCAGPGRAHHARHPSHHEAICNTPVRAINGTSPQDAKRRGVRGQPAQCMALPRPGIHCRKLCVGPNPTAASNSPRQARGERGYAACPRHAQPWPQPPPGPCARTCPEPRPRWTWQSAVCSCGATAAMVQPSVCPSGQGGGLKIHCRQLCVGSNPTAVSNSPQASGR